MQVLPSLSLSTKGGMCCLLFLGPEYLEVDVRVCLSSFFPTPLSYQYIVVLMLFVTPN